MRVLLFQFDIQWADAAANRAHIAQVLQGQPQCDLIVLPEVFTTGFGGQPSEVAEPAAGGATLEWMKRLAREYDSAVAGSVAVREADTFRNRNYFVKPTGEVAFYDKHHLFHFAGEDGYTAGNERVVVEWRGVRFMLLTCFDLRFPAWSRCHEDYDVILYSANWPTTRIGQWRTLIRARAIENQCYVVAVNRIGKDPNCAYSGESAVIHPLGHDLVCCGNSEMAVSVELDLEAQNTLRKKFPLLKERDRVVVQS